MEAGDFRAVPIALNGKLIGITSDRDIRGSGLKTDTTKSKSCREIRSAFPPMTA
jgi:hypothetical protein